MTADNPIVNKSEDFAIRIVQLCQVLNNKINPHRETVMSKQILRSGTSIGANIAEAQYGVSKKEFRVKLQISLKEANETRYWLKLLYKTKYITPNIYDSLKKECEEIIALLTSIIKTASADKDNSEIIIEDTATFLDM